MQPSPPANPPPAAARRSNGWTEAQRRAQAERMRAWKPWEKSTGPRTAAGKRRSASNASRGGVRRKIRQLSKLLRRLAGGRPSRRSTSPKAQRTHPTHSAMSKAITPLALAPFKQQRRASQGPRGTPSESSAPSAVTSKHRATSCSSSFAVQSTLHFWLAGGRLWGM